MHSCKRCGYESRRKYDVITHLQKKNRCSPIHDDTDRETLLRELRNQPHGNSYERQRNKQLQSQEEDDLIKAMRAELDNLKQLVYDLTAMKCVNK